MWIPFKKRSTKSPPQNNWKLQLQFAEAEKTKFCCSLIGRSLSLGRRECENKYFILRALNSVTVQLFGSESVHICIYSENTIAKSLSWILLMKGNLLGIRLGRVLIMLFILTSKCSQIHNLLILLPAVPEFGVVLIFKSGSDAG